MSITWCPCTHVYTTSNIGVYHRAYTKMHLSFQLPTNNFHLKIPFAIHCSKVQWHATYPKSPSKCPQLSLLFSFLFFWCMCWSLGPSYTTPFMVLNVTCVIVSLHDTWCSSAHTNILARVYSTMLWDVCLCYTTVYKLTKCTQMTHDISMLNNILFLHIKI